MSDEHDQERGEWWDEEIRKPLGNNEELLEGVVERTSPYGFVLAGRPGWLDWSKLSKGPRPALEPGDAVVVRIGRGKWVNAVAKPPGSRDAGGSGDAGR